MEAPKIQKVRLKVGGMTCINCQTKIQSHLLKLKGISKARVSWKGEFAEVEFDEKQISISKIISEIENIDYKVNQ